MRRNNIVRVAVVISVPLAVYALYQIFEIVTLNLGLRGESYQTIYEIDLPTWVREQAKNKDEQFEKETATPDMSFFEVMQKKFAMIEIGLNHYFDSHSQTDAQRRQDGSLAPNLRVHGFFGG